MGTFTLDPSLAACCHLFCALLGSCFLCKTKKGNQNQEGTLKIKKVKSKQEGTLKRPPNLQENDLDGWWQLRPGARLPSEAELRRMLSPDQWCLYDTTKAGIHRLWEQGISKYDALCQIPAERMQIAIEQLPEVCTLTYCFSAELQSSLLCYHCRVVIGLAPSDCKRTITTEPKSHLEFVHSLDLRHSI